MKLEGTLQTFPLRELIDMIIYSSVTGSLNIYDSAAPGHLFFRDGHLYHVDKGPLNGLSAFAALLEIQSATFAFVSDVISDQETLWGDIDSHIRQAERLALRWRQVRAYVASVDLLPVLLQSPEVTLRRTSPSYHQLVAQIDGARSLRDIATLLNWGEIDVAEAAAAMVLDGLVELRQADGSGSRHGGPASRDGLFDRLAGRSSATETPAPQRRSGAEDMILQLLRG